MADAADASPEAARAAEQARLRKAKREAKLKAGGSTRLDKITGMGGRPKADFDPPATNETPKTAPAAATAAAATSNLPADNADPEEVDISQHYYAPQTTARSTHTASPGPRPEVSEDALRQMMLGFDPTQNPRGGGPPGAQGPLPFPGAAGADDDPLMKMMSQMMGGEGGSNPFAGMPNFGNMQQQASGPQPIDSYTAMWRVLHALVALGLGLYITILTPFTGTKLERDTASVEENEHHKRTFFWVFATAEACLLTTRFFLDKGRAPPPGIAWTLTGYLPNPWKDYVQAIMRYGRIFTTVRADILGCMFVLGACHWWRTSSVDY